MSSLAELTDEELEERLVKTYRRHVSRRLDADMTDREMALALLHNLGIDPLTTPTGTNRKGPPIAERSDAYVIARAISAAELIDNPRSK